MTFNFNVISRGPIMIRPQEYIGVLKLYLRGPLTRLLLTKCGEAYEDEALPFLYQI